MYKYKVGGYMPCSGRDVSGFRSNVTEVRRFRSRGRWRHQTRGAIN